MNKKFKVLVLGNCCLQHFPLLDYGGIESSVEHLCTGIYNHFKDEIEFCVIVPKIIENRECTSSYGFKIIETNYIGCSISNIHPIYFAQEIKQIIQSANIKPDVIWCNGDWSAKVLYDLNIPIICTISDSGPWVEGKYIYQPNVYYRFISKFLYDFVLQDENTNSLVCNVKKNSFWCYTGLDDNEFILEENKENYLLWVAGLGWGFEGKGLDIFIELAKRLPKENFVAYGSGDVNLENYLNNISKEIPNFDFRGKLIRGKPHVDAFKNAKLFFMLTKTSEALGRTNIEALSKGTPVIGSTYGAVPELINYDNVGFSSDNIDDIINVIRNRKFNYKECFKFARDKYHVKNEINSLLEFTKQIII